MFSPSVAIKAVQGKIDQGGGPIWRYKDPGNYYVVRVNPREANFRLYKVVAGKRTHIAFGPRLSLLHASGRRSAWSTRETTSGAPAHGQLEIDAKDAANPAASGPDQGRRGKPLRQPLGVRGEIGIDVLAANSSTAIGSRIKVAAFSG